MSSSYTDSLPLKRMTGSKEGRAIFCFSKTMHSLNPASKVKWILSWILIFKIYYFFHIIEGYVVICIELDRVTFTLLAEVLG